jgi:S-layer homology domain
MRIRSVVLAAVLASAALVPSATAAPAPVAAGGPASWAIYGQLYEDADGAHYVGYLESLQLFRITDVTLTVAWIGEGLATIASETVALDLQHVAPGAWIPFHVLETEDISARVSDLPHTFITHEASDVVPVVGLDVDTPLLEGKVATGSITNESETLTATDVVVYGGLLGESFLANWFVDMAVAETIAEIAPGETVQYTITFDEDALAGSGVRVVAETNSGPYMTTWANYFSDIHPLNYGREEIIWLADERITEGCGRARFCPHRLLTRAEAAVFLDRALELADTTVDHFSDDDGSFAEQSINDAAEAGLVDGCGPSAFCPEGGVTRGQMSKMLVLGYDIPAATNPDHFTDDDGSFSEPYNDALFESGVTQGCSRWAPWYCPNRVLTRIHTALLLYRAEHLGP